MAIENTSRTRANRPTDANNVAEREEQVAAISARAMRLSAATMGRLYVPSPQKSAELQAPVRVTPRYVDARPRSSKAPMKSSEAQARTRIAAALIVSGAVKVPSIPPPGGSPDNDGVRLRALTDYVYQLVTMRPDR